MKSEGQGMLSLALDEDWKPEETGCLTLFWSPGTLIPIQPQINITR